MNKEIFDLKIGHQLVQKDLIDLQDKINDRFDSIQDEINQLRDGINFLVNKFS